MHWLGSTTGLLVMVALAVALLIAAFVAMAMAATAYSSTERGRWVAALLLAKLCALLAGCGALLSVVLNVVRFAKEV